MSSEPGYSSAEIRSGFFVLLAIVILLVMTFVVGGWLKGGTDEWQVRFSYLNGLEDSAPVYYAGREVGKVTKIEIIQGAPRPILVTVKVSPEAYVRKDSQSYIDTLGMMGEKFVEISPGSPDAPAMEKGNIIEGTDPIAMHQMVSKMNLLADQMDAMVKTLNPLIANTNNLLEGHEEEISKTLTNIHEITANLRDMTEDLKQRPWRLVRKG
ncbi:MAG: mce related protein [Candidatus Omnitrophica bacterium ADurb.Bin314]|jgi:phospholipid/cholesterol/gamma-HCH transport system substrate-binding protein|nr:MAG: mce related protein [Candidatus Omnitrophica bacterium ADurb.Bin314]HOE68713.1 MlaD family protein [Candidatus Omnitrophota bacterium]